MNVKQLQRKKKKYCDTTKRHNNQKSTQNHYKETSNNYKGLGTSATKLRHTQGQKQPIKKAHVN